MKRGGTTPVVIRVIMRKAGCRMPRPGNGKMNGLKHPVPPNAKRRGTGIVIRNAGPTRRNAKCAVKISAKAFIATGRIATANITANRPGQSRRATTTSGCRKVIGPKNRDGTMSPTTSASAKGTESSRIESPMKIDLSTGIFLRATAIRNGTAAHLG